MASKRNPLTRAEIFGLSALGLAVFVIANDFTAFSVALPAMEKELHTDVTTMQWVINGYALLFGVLIISGGRLADMFGRRRMFFVGAAIFAFFSLLGGLAVDVAMLLICRALMGVGAALMWPAVLGMIYCLMPDDRAGLAGGMIMSICGIGNSTGPLLGGTLTEMLSWRWIFFINIPIAAIAVLVTWRVVARDKLEATDERIDYKGVSALSLSLFALLLALDMGVDTGFKNFTIIALLVTFVAAMGTFLWIERHAGRNALIPKDVFDNHQFFAAGLATLLMSVIFFAALFYLPQFFSKKLGFSAMQSGMGLLPMMMVFGVCALIAGTLYEKLGAKRIVSTGAVCLAVGMWLVRPDTHTTYAHLVPGMMILGAGIGLFYSTITTIAITSVDPIRSSLASAILYMFQIAGGAIGLGMNTTIVATATALPEGISRAFMVNTGLALAGLVVCVLFVGGNKRKTAKPN